jgi:heptosyltransferase-2/heptosyltransferase-3
MLVRAGFRDEFIVDAKDHPLLPGEHATQHWRRLARILPAAGSPAAARPSSGREEDEDLLDESGGCHLDVSNVQRADLEGWLRARGLSSRPLIAVQAGNKRTMRRGLRRLAVNSKYWPNEQWAVVLRHLRARNQSHAIMLLGTGPEFVLNQEIMACAGVDDLHNAADDLPIPRLVALLAHAQPNMLGIDARDVMAAWDALGLRA